MTVRGEEGVTGERQFPTEVDWGKAAVRAGQQNISVIACGSGCLSSERPDITQSCRLALFMSRVKMDQQLKYVFGMLKYDRHNDFAHQPFCLLIHKCSILQVLLSGNHFYILETYYTPGAVGIQCQESRSR